MIDSPSSPLASPVAKSESAFRTISEVADDLGVQQHVLRFWETKFTQVKPLKRGGGRRYYRPEDVALLKKIHTLLYAEGYTIKGVQKLLKGVSKVQVLAEQKQGLPEQSSKAYGASLPKVAGPAIPKNELPPAEDVVLQSASLPAQAMVLKSILDELLDMREQVNALISDHSDQSSAMASSEVTTKSA